MKKKQLLKPNALKPGDKVGLVCPASRPKSPAVVENACRLVREMGFVPILGQYVLETYGYMAGTDKQRLEDLTGFLLDDSIAGIFCITGGFGSLHLLPYLDYDQLIKTPKVLVGTDDNCCWLLAVHAKSRLVTFNGPNLDQIQSKFTFEHFKNAVTQKKPLGELSPNGYDNLFSQIYSPVKEVAEGTLMGGNLTALVSLMGTPYQPCFDETVLFLEDRDERNDILDRWFTNLYVSGALSKTNGIAFGAFINCDTRDSYNMLSLEDLFGQRLIDMFKPSCFGLPIGQANDVFTVPVGTKARLDSGVGKIEFLEPAP